jgi:hypothetical protein
MAICPKAGYFLAAGTIIGTMTLPKVLRDLHVLDSKVQGASIPFTWIYFHLGVAVA